MKRSTLLTIATLAAAITLGLAGAAHARPWGNAEHAACGGYHYIAADADQHHPWMEKLNLTAEQKTKIDKIRAAQKEKVAPVAEQLRAEMETLRTMMQGDATDAQLREQHRKVHALRSTLGDAWFESILQIRAILTPEQRKEMGAMHQMGKGSRMGPGSKGPRGGQGPGGYGPMGGHPY